MDSRTVSIASRFNRGIAVCGWVLALSFVAAVALGRPEDLVQTLFGASFVSVIAWMVFWHPRVSFDDSAVELVGALRTITVPWAALVHVTTRFALTLHTPHGSWSALSAPAPGPVATLAMVPRNRPGVAYDGSPGLPHGDLIGSDSGDLATLVRARWREMLDSGRVPAGVADGVPVTIQWHPTPLLIALALLGGAVVAAALT